MTTEEAMDISVEVDGNDVMIWFRWNYVKYARAAYVSRADGGASLGLSRDGAQELHRQLGEALKSPEANGIDHNYEQARADHADAGHPDEEAAAEADYKGDPAREPSDARSGA